ncbi:phosphatidylinositol phosphatase PTPRQ [Erpetoichthys calabaricus]|uniref:phosphatidylinositol phosphatase PTPRQ n=1 Tax=Erpetoichthys calabaricus TaxID=27687 RepID=UPI002234D167|nr:phosphatidylinositol phosphatase PTPRQ [Erpetoichthys calabaricus]
MDKSILLLLLGCFQVTHLHKCPRTASHVELLVEWSDFPKREKAQCYLVDYHLLKNPRNMIMLNVSTASRCFRDSSIQIPGLEENEDYRITLMSMSHSVILGRKSFHLRLVSGTKIRTEVTSTSALFNWSKLDRIFSVKIKLHNSSWTILPDQTNFQVQGLKPGTLYSFSMEFKTSLQDLEISITQKLNVFLETSLCPLDWMPFRSSCYKIGKDTQIWSAAQEGCGRALPGSHLVNIGMEEEHQFISSYLRSLNHVLMLWTGLNDKQEEGVLQWTDGTIYNLKNVMSASLPSNETDCYAMQMNATGPNYFFTEFFCYIPLPFLCEYEFASVPDDFQLHVEDVKESEVTFSWFSLQRWLKAEHFSEYFLQYHAELVGNRPVMRKLPSNSTRFTILGLSPGSTYVFALKVAHAGGASQIISPMLRVETRPNPPQNVTVKKIGSNKIPLYWTAPDASQNASFSYYLINYVDGVTNIKETLVVESYKTCALISHIKPHNLYRISIQSVTATGVGSCVDNPITIITAVSPPNKVFINLEDVGEDYLTVYWDPPEEDPDGYYVHVRQVMDKTQHKVYWVNNSNNITLSKLIPGMTYEAGVVAVKNGNRSELKIVQQTLRPKMVKIVVPYELNSHSVVLYVQRPAEGIFDGIKVAYHGGRNWKLISKGDSKITIDQLSPGMEYNFTVYTTSLNMTSSAYQVPPVKTCLAPPTNIKEGTVSETTAEILWDRAEGMFQNYEVICLNCVPNYMVQKVEQEKAVFSSLIPGKLYHFSIRTEKENFKDSIQVYHKVQTVPSQVKFANHSKISNTITVYWSEAQNVFDGYMVSITNGSFYQEKTFSTGNPRTHRFGYLLPGSSYVINIVTTSGNKRSKPTVIIATTFPDPPQDIEFVELDETSIYVSWKSPLGRVDAYKLLYKLPANNKTLYVTRVTGNSTQIKNLYPGSDYMFEIQSLSASESSMAVSKLFTARPPGVCSLSVSSITTCTAEIIWKSSSGIFDHYKVTVSNSTFLRELTVAKLWLNFTANDLSPGCTYNFTVSRVRKNIEGTSAVVTIVADPEKPQELEVVNVTSNSFSVHWIAPPGHVDRYHVVVSPSRGDVIVKDLGSNRIQATVTNAVPGQNYTITVSAVSSSSFSSHVVKYVTTYETPPSQPLNVEGEGVGSTAILFSWTPSQFLNGEIISHVIHFREVCPWPETSFKEVLSYSSSPEYLLSNLNAGSTYEIKVAAQNSAGTGNFSYPIFFKTDDYAPGQVSNLIAFTYNHTTVNVKWFLPKRPNGRITKFVVNTKLARSGQLVKSIEISADEVLKDGVPECFNNSELYSRTIFSPITSTSSLPVSAMPFGFAWSVPISVVVDQLKPYTSYVFEVFPHTKDYEGQVSTALVRMPESVPEDAPQNPAKGNITSKSFSVFWDSPTIVTGKFSYKVELYGPSGRIFENITRDLRFSYFGLTPYTMYTVFVGAETVAGLGPKSNISIFTPAEAPGPVSDLKAKSVGSTSVTLSWKTPLQQNGIIIQYKILVLKMNQGTVVQNIVIARKQKEANGSMLLSDGMLTEPFEGSADTSRLPANTVTLPASPAVRLAALTNKLSTSSEDNSKSTLSDISQVLLTSPLPQSSFLVTNSKKVSTNEMLSLPYTGNDAAHLLQGNGADTGYSYTLPVQQRVKRSVVSVVTTDGTVFTSPTQPPPSSRAASAFPNVIEETTTFQTSDLSVEEMSYIVTNLLPYTDYTFNVSASTAVGEGPQASIAVKTKEQVPGSVQDVTYQNITSSSVLVFWKAPYRPNGRITHYTVYGMDLFTNEAFQKTTNETSIILSGLKKYGLYKLRVAASTAAGESSLSEQDDMFVRTLEDEPESPPQNITVKNVTATSANLHWSPPDKPNGIIQYYEAIYVSKTGMFKLNTSGTNIILQNLKPYTVYNFSVKAYTRYGHGNQSSSVFTVLTDESAPGSPPFNLTYEAISSTKVEVSWISPLHANGIILSYTIQYWNASHSLNLTSNSTQVILSNLRKYARYQLTVSANTKFGNGNQTSDILNIITMEDVPDDAPHNLSYSNLSSASLQLCYLPPFFPNGKIVLYTICYMGANGIREYRNTTKQCVVLRELQKNSVYSLTVTAYTTKGKGRQSSETLSIHTEEDVPDSAPENITFKVLSSTTIQILFLPPRLPNGIIRKYTIFLTPQNETVLQIVNTTFLTNNITGLRKYTNYTIQLSASTSKGEGVRSKNITILTGEDVPSSPPRALSVKHMPDSVVKLSWKPPLHPNGEIKYYTIHVWSETKEIVQNVSNMSVLLDDLESNSEYHAYVTSSTRLGDGGVKSEAVVFHTSEGAPADPPGNLSYVNISSTSIEVLWMPPSKPNGIIQFYTVYYSNSSGNIYSQNVTDIDFENVNENQTYSTIINDMMKYSYYNLWMTASTALGDGNQTSTILAVHTDEDVPEDSVQNLTLLSWCARRISLAWFPPLKPNGIIIKYHLSVNSNQTFIIQPSHTFFILHDLTPFTCYDVNISGFTVKGEGPGLHLSVLTDEDIPDDTVQNLIYQNVSSTAVNISWLPPTSPNGKVFYFVSLWKPGMSTFLMNSTSTKMHITIEDLEKYTDYILKVTPATGAGFLENSTVSLQFKTDEDAPGTPPKFIKYKNLTASSIELFWEPPDQTNGIITSYDINFQGPAKSHTFSTANMSHVLFNLIPYTLYNVSISARTRKGSGPLTTQLVHTDETEPSAPPQNLSVVSYTAESVWLKWNPSLKPNGFVQVYSFEIFNNQSQLVSYQNFSAQFTEANLTGLQPFSQYQISVSAFTRVGNGNLFSNTVSFTTKQSVPDIVQNLLCSGTSWQSVLVQWDAPAKPNGVITHYVVQFGSEIMEFEPTDRVHTFRDLLANSSYTYYVMASTVVGRGKRLSCVAKTLQESVPSAPLNVKVKTIQPTNVTLGWTRPEQVPGNLLNYQIVGQMLSLLCNDWIRKECLEKEVNQFAYGDGNELEATVYSLMKFRDYRFTVAATTSAGYGNSSEWVYTKTEVGDPDEPPENVIVVSSSFNSINISWEPPRVITGPTSYLIDIFSLDTQDYNETFTKKPEEARLIFLSDLTAFTKYGVRITAYTGKDHDARIHGKACPLVIVTTMEDKPKDPPKNISFQKLPEDVTKVYITFSPPSEPNGNIIMYQATVEKDGDFSTQTHNLQIVENKNQSLTAVIEGLKGGYTYRISVYAVNGAGSGPKIHLNITTDIQAPPQPNKKPEAFEQNGALLISSTTITIKMPQCFFSDAHGPIRHIQVIVSESGVKNDINISTWKEAFFKKPRPYFTNEGFPNPQCSNGRKDPFSDETYTIGAEESCMLPENEQEICNGPLKPGKQYVFKFRATNVKGQYTDSEFSNPVKTLVEGMSDQAVEITLAVTLCVLSIILLVAAIYAFARIRQKQKEGGTYSPRDAEIIDTKFKLDQLITVADLELKEEKLTRYSSFFFRRKEIFVIQLLSYRKSLKPVNKKSFLQHLEELCANNNFKFQEEFSELPKLLQDLATTDADLPWNRSKNRFTNIKPYNNNRVKLMSEPGVPGSDYINASYVSGYLCPNEFIATQGPLPGTVADFWRMIWETRTRTIVMLTQCFEKGRIRCHQYWPEDNKPVTVFGDIVITKLTENVQPDWAVRDLKVERHGDYMVVRHFNFTSWPEHGVPESSTAIIHFVKLIRAIRAHENTTIAVHCSAGVGRTGVFIALDHLLQHVSDHDFVDIYGLVAELRRERMCMVQNLAQYMFLHQCALDLLSSKGNSQSVWFVNYSALEKMDSLDAMEGDVELEWEETTM